MSTDQPILAPNGDVLFTHDELSCNRTQRVRLATGFADKLRELRLAWGRPMSVNSCCRSQAYNSDIGGAVDSFHVYDFPGHGLDGTCAIDIAIPDAVTAMELIALAIPLGWSVGLPSPRKRFVHLDQRRLAGLKPAAFGY